MKEKNFDGREVQLNYAESALNGPPLLLLHGMSFRWQSFSSLIPKLSEHRHVYALDFRGHGKSSHEFARYRFQDLVNDTVEFITEYIGKPTTIFGHSLGAAVGFAAAARLRERVSSLILADNFLFHDSMLEITGLPLLRSMFRGVQGIASVTHTSGEVLQRLVGTTLPLGEGKVTVGELFAGKSGFLAAWAESIAQLDPKTVEIFFTPLSTEEFDGDTWLREISCPILLLQAKPELGGIMPHRDVERVMSIRPRTAVHRFNLGHMMHMEDAESIIPIVQGFLDSA